MVSAGEVSYRALLAREHRSVVLASSGATLLASLDALMIATALPSTARELGGIELFGLAVGAYAVTTAVALPVGGALVDRGGPWRVLLAGAALFGLGCILGGSANSMEVVALARALQGLGAGLLFSIPAAVVVLRIPAELRRHALAVNSVIWGVSALAGPALGALLTATLSWRWTFWINLPPLLLTVLLGAAGFRGRAWVRGRADRLNLVGPTLLGAGILALLVEPLLAVVPALVFLLHERRSAVPVFPRSAGGRAVAAVSAASGVAFLGADAFVPLDLQAGAGWTVAEAAAPIVTSTLAWSLGAVVSARLQLPAGRQVRIGFVLVIGGVLAMGIPVAGGMLVAVGLTVGGIGMGLLSAGMFVAVAEIGERSGRATSSLILARTLGGGVGVAVAGGVIVALAGPEALDAAERGGGAVRDIHAAAHAAFLACAVLGLLALPAVRGLARGREAPGVPERSPDRSVP